MIRAALSLTALLLLARVAWTQDVPKAQPAKPQAPKYNPNDPQSIIDYIIAEARTLRRESDLLTVRIKQNELERLLAGLPAGVAELQDGIVKAAREVRLSRENLDVRATALAVLIQKVRDNPDDWNAIERLRGRLFFEIRPHFIFDPEAASQKLETVKPVLAKAEQLTQSDTTKKLLATIQKDVARFEENVALSKDAREKQQALIGQPAPPLVVEMWLNGTPLSAEDLKGKVILLGFFSAISLCPEQDNWEDFPAHLKQLAQWQTKYAQRGLVVIGVTSYTNVRWDEARQVLEYVPAKMGKVPREEQRAALAKVAKAQGWTQRVAIQQLDEHYKTIRQYPALSEQSIVIDREGKIRLVRGGVCEQFTRDIGNELESLLPSADR